MGWFEGMLGGFASRKSEVEAQNLAEAQRSQQRESQILNALLSSPDPDIQSLAATGLLHSAQPMQRKSGLRGWIGEMESSPYLSQIQELIKQPRTVMEETPTGEPPTVPSTQTQGYLSTVPGQQPAALPGTSSVDVGAPPPTPVESKSTTTASPSVTPTRQTSVLRQRQLFLSPVEAYKQQAIAKAGADIEGDVQAYTPYLGRQGAVERVLYERGLKGAGGLGISHVFVETPDGQQHAAIFDARRQQYIDPDTQRPLVGAKPLSHTASMSLGADREAISRELGYGPAAGVTDPAKMAHINAMVFQRHGQLTPDKALSAASRMLPNATVEQQIQLADALQAGTAAPIGAPAAAPAATPGAAPTAAAPGPVSAGGVGAPPPAPGGPSAAAISGAGAPAAAAGTAAAPTAVAGQPPPKPGGIGARIPASLASASRETGRPLAPQVANTLAAAKSTNHLIDQALTALDPYKSDNTLAGSIKLAKNYRHGFDSVTSAAAQLSDLAGLQSAARGQLTGGSSRALRYYVDRRQHVPRLPSGRQVDAASIIGPEATYHASQWLQRDAEEAGFDSPQLMYQKLLNARKNNQQYIDDLEQTQGVTKPGGAGGTEPGTPPPAPPASAAAAGAIRPVASHSGAAQTGPGSDWTMVNGVLHYQGKPY